MEGKIDSHGFDRDGFDLSRPIVRVHPSPALCVIHSKFRLFYTIQGLKLDNHRIKDRMRHNSFKVTCLKKEEFDFHMYISEVSDPRQRKLVFFNDIILKRFYIINLII